MRSTGNRAAWLAACAAVIQDGGSSPPSFDRLAQLAPNRVGTAVNDGHVTAGIVYGEAARPDYRRGQRYFIEESVAELCKAGLVAGDSDGWRWIAPLDGEFKVEVDGHTYVIYGQRERRMSWDRSMLGERQEDTGELIGPPGMFASGKSVPLALEIRGIRGGVLAEKIKLEVHPLALTIPPMTERERETLRMSIERDGVQMPIVLYQKKILDGRHRAYFASILHKPIIIKEFEGTEEQAKRQVAILNLHRRHLSTAQQAAIIRAMFGEQAKAEATKARIATVGRPKKLSTEKRSIIEDRHAGRWEYIAAQKTKEIGLDVSPKAIKLMDTVALAPKTSAAVERGEIKTISKAHEKALEELRQPATKLVQTVDSLSINRRLGRCITELRAILIDCDDETEIGREPELLSERLNEIERLAFRVREALRQRKIIA